MGEDVGDRARGISPLIPDTDRLLEDERVARLGAAGCSGVCNWRPRVVESELELSTPASDMEKTTSSGDGMEKTSLEQAGKRPLVRGGCFLLYVHVTGRQRAAESGRVHWRVKGRARDNKAKDRRDQRQPQGQSQGRLRRVVEPRVQVEKTDTPPRERQWLRERERLSHWLALLFIKALWSDVELRETRSSRYN